MTDLFGSEIIAGIDEVGRGPLAGPVVTAAVILPKPIVGLADSKTLSKKRREALFPQIMSQALVGIGAASVCEIDQLNILHATMLAMRRAVPAPSRRADAGVGRWQSEPGSGPAHGIDRQRATPRFLRFLRLPSSRKSFAIA